MASAAVEENLDNKLFFCHSCSCKVHPTQDLTCSQCDSGAIEEVDSDDRTATENDEESANDFINVFRDTMRGHGRRRRSHSYLLRQNNSQLPQHRQNQFMVQIGSPGTGLHFGTSTRGGSGEIDMFLQQLAGNLGFHCNGFGGNQSGNMMFNGNMGDYAWGPNGLDNIITQLLNQLDNSGPPPAEISKIDSLPIHSITQEDLDQKAECAVCQDQFIMEEKVKQLPCKHNFHTPCIDPWLKMHDSCPICRTNLNGERSRDDK